MYDVVIVGARCAGAPAAMLLAKQGLDVLLIDRATFPSDTMSTLYIQMTGAGLLKRWGLLETIGASGCPLLDHVVYQLGEVRLEGAPTPPEGIRGTYGPRRFVLDEVLVRAAADAGVEVREACSLVEVTRDPDGRVDGIVCSYRDAEGRTVCATERAHLVVGADGLRSPTARLVGARTIIEDPRLTCAYYSLWEGVHASFEMYEGATGWVSAVPTHDAVLISCYHPQAQFAEVRTRAEEAYLEGIRDNAAPLHTQLGDAVMTEPLRGTGNQQNFFRQAWGPGWALIGDAGHHKDSLPARGISDAFLQAQLLAHHIGRATDDPTVLDAALARFEADRDAALMPGYRATLMVAEASARPQRAQLIHAVAGDAELTQRYFDTAAGLRPVSDLYTPELLARLGDDVGAQPVGAPTS